MFCSLIHIEGESNDQRRRLPRSTAVWTSNLVRMTRSVLNDLECGPLSRMGPPEYDRNCIDHQRAFPVSPNVVLLWTDAFSHSGQRCHSGMNNRYTEGNIFVAAQEIGERQNFCKGSECRTEHTSAIGTPQRFEKYEIVQATLLWMSLSTLRRGRASSLQCTDPKGQ